MFADEPYFENVRGRLFPVLGLEENVAIEANFGNDLMNKPFKWSDEVENEKEVLLNGK